MDISKLTIKNLYKIPFNEMDKYDEKKKQAIEKIEK